MLSFFNKRASHALPQLSNLDISLYPIKWHDQVCSSPYDLLLEIIDELIAKINTADVSFIDACSSLQKEGRVFSQLLQTNAVYQDWINFTVYGRYIQRSFSAFTQQSEDSFNQDMPVLLRNELLRHAQRLPNNQVLFISGQIPRSARQSKYLVATLNPVYALNAAIKQTQANQAKSIIINQITIHSDQVTAFAIKHNKRTRDAIRHEVIILDFATLTQVKETTYPLQNPSNQKFPPVRVKHYVLK